jgi:uncharacterized protein (TIGR03000 family)
MLLGNLPVHAQHGHGGGHGGFHGGYHGGSFYHGGYWHGGYGGFYRPYGFYPYGFYRPYYGIGAFGLGLGLGLGLGALYAPYYGSYAYPIAPGYAYGPSTVIVNNAPPGGMPLGPGVQGAQPAPQQTPQRPPPDNAGHLQLFLPENAEVFIDGKKISQTGTTREIVTPTLSPNTRYTYKVSVRYTDAQGKAVNDTRDIHFQANDWFSIDFTRPAPPMAPPQQAPPQQPPPPQPLPEPLR